MRKVSSTLVALALVFGAVLAPAAEAGRKKPKKKVKTTRTVSAEYTSSGGVAAAGGTFRLCLQDQGCLTFSAKPREKYVSLEVSEEATGTPAPFLVSLDGGSDTGYCGTTPAPIWLKGATEISITMVSVSLPDCTGFSTSGTLTATFSNLP